MVMPRSRSMSIESRYCSRMSRASTAPVSSRMRSDRVDFPWSTWATMLRLRICSRFTGFQGDKGGLRRLPPSSVAQEVRQHRLAYCFFIVNSSGPSFEPVITVSATYGAGGSVIAPRLAKQLGLPFVDRLISADLSEQATSQEGLVAGEQENTPVGRFLSYFARAASVGTVVGPDPQLDEDEDIRARTE